MQIVVDTTVSTFSEYINNISGIDVSKCYQCGKCSAGCPVSQFIEESPTKVIRFIQLGQKELVYKSKTPYLCASCNTCSARCPMEIDITKLMESIRIAAKSNNIKPAVKKVAQFSETFLSTLRKNGRLFELGFMLKFKLKSMTPFQDMELSPVMLLNRKLGFIPQRIKNIKRIREIFEKAKFFAEENRTQVKSH